jgi:hypothetical protein
MSPASTNTVILLVLLALVVGSIIIWRRWGRPSASPRPAVTPPVPPTTPPAATGAPAPAAAALTPAAPAAATPSPAAAPSSGFDWGALGRGIRLVVFWLVGIAIAIAVIGFVTTYNAWPITIAVLVLLAVIGIPSYFGGKKLFKGAGGFISVTIFMAATLVIAWIAWDVITRGPSATRASLQGLGQVYTRLVGDPGTGGSVTLLTAPPRENGEARYTRPVELRHDSRIVLTNCASPVFDRPVHTELSRRLREQFPRASSHNPLEHLDWERTPAGAQKPLTISSELHTVLRGMVNESRSPQILFTATPCINPSR